MQEVISILERVGAIKLNDHFVGTSGRHLEGYINKDMLYPHTAETSRICELFAEQFKDTAIDVIAAPAMGGVILSTWTAHHLSRIQGKEVLSVYAEKVNSELTFTRGYDAFVKGKNVLVIEDLTTTGGSLKKSIDVVVLAGGTVVAACTMVNKDPAMVTSELFGAPFTALAELVVKSYSEEECPLCKNSIPINTTVGHGKKFLEAKKLATV